jgi:hypothetical protein
VGFRGVADSCEHGRKVHIEYSFDRLSERKIIQAYRTLIPDKIWMTGHEGQGVKQAEEIIRDEDSSDLRPSLLRATEG